jgi:hypothetical protein
MATSFSGGGSRSTRRESPTLGKQLINFIRESPTLGKQLINFIRESPTLGKQLINFITCESSEPFFAIYKAGREPTPYW